jgi:K+-sensing histidine kinase KdpD
MTFSIEQVRFFRTFADLSAVTIENIHLFEETRHVEVSKTLEKLQTAMINSISHDLRTPLSSIIGALSSLQEEGMQLNETYKANLLQYFHGTSIIPVKLNLFIGYALSSVTAVLRILYFPDLAIASAANCCEMSTSECFSNRY